MCCYYVVMVKITDVAEAAGVSPSTVSHVLSGNRPISEETKKRVLNIIKELGYTPNPNARAMKSSRTGIIGFFAGDITEVFVTEIIRGVESVIVPAGYHLLLVSGSEFDDDPRQALEFLISRRIDGAIISYGTSDIKTDSGFGNMSLPLVFINRSYNDVIPCIRPDNYMGGKVVASHFAECGVKKAAIIGGPEKRQASRDRIRGFIERSEELGMEVPEGCVFHTEFTFDGGRKAMKVLLERGKGFDGLFCANDYIACGAMTVAQEAGLSIPDDLKVIGFDDREFARFWPTPVTTMSQPLFQMGRLGARYLVDFNEKEKEIPLLTVLSSSLIPRRSTGF